MGFLKGLHVLGEAGYVEFDVPLRAFAGQSVCVRAQLCWSLYIANQLRIFVLKPFTIRRVLYAVCGGLQRRVAYSSCVVCHGFCSLRRNTERRSVSAIESAFDACFVMEACMQSCGLYVDLCVVYVSL